MPRVLFSLGAPCKEFFQPSRRRLAPASLPSPPAPPQPPRLRPLRRPAGLSLHPPRLPSPHDPPKMLAGLLEVPKPPTPNTPATAFPDHPRQIPSIVLVAGEEENPFYLALRVPQRQRRRLPVTPLPPASYRHRLPQQPANCSETTGPPIG